LRARSSAFQAAVEDRRSVAAGYLPSVDLNASTGGADRQYDGRGTYARNLAEVSVTQLLFTGFRLKYQLERADHTRLIRYYELLDEAQTKALEASEAYMDVQRYRQMV